MRLKILLLLAILAFIIFIPNIVFASETDGSIDSTYKYAWSENIGWINFGVSGGNVNIDDSDLTGYAWSANYGWINLAPTGSGVKNTVEGTLSGSAWGENVGWIDFTGVTIDTSGYFQGYANGSITGQISFNCANTNSCTSSDFKVRTDWRPQSVRTPVDTSSAQLSELADLKYVAVEEDEVITEAIQVTFAVEVSIEVDVVVDEETETATATATVTIPSETVVDVVEQQGEVEATMDFTQLVIEDVPDEVSNIEGEHIVSAIEYGVPEKNITFSKEVTISIPVDSGYNGQTLNVFKSDTGTGGWALLATCEVVNDICTFTTTSASYFSVTQTSGGGLPPAAYSAPVSPPGGFKLIITPTITINDGDNITQSRFVTLSSNAGDDVAEMSISNTPGFENTALQEYSATQAWDLCSSIGGAVTLQICPEGLYTVYAKFYTEWGQSSEAVSDSIEFRTSASEKDLVKTADSGAVYLILNGTRHVFPHLSVYQSWVYPDDFSTVKTISVAALGNFSQGDPVPFRNGSLFRGMATSLYGKEASAVFYVEDGELKPVISAEIYQELFDDQEWELVTWVPDDLLSKFAYPLGEVIVSSDIHPNGSLVRYVYSPTIYLIENGKKRAFSSRSALVSNGYEKKKIFTIPLAESYETAEPISSLSERLTTPSIASVGSISP